jgi:serine/threonine protein kinase
MQDSDRWRRRPATGDGQVLIDIVRAVVARRGTEEWTVEPHGTWCRVNPPHTPMPNQGWKLHVSATPLSAPVVLARVADVLAGAGCVFKFARDLDTVGWLVSGQVDRGRAGKFITAYPIGDDQFRRLGARLDEVTDGLPGPAILSDRAWRPGSLVQYRFGVFAAAPVLTNDGTFESMLTGPDGRLLKDERRAWFSPPAWAVLPLADHPRAADPAPGGGVIIADRFVVKRAIRHSYRGGVFRAMDQRTGCEVALKQARPHTLSALDGTDSRDLLRREAAVLAQLGPLGLSPAPVALVEQQENLFLAEELVAGTTLRVWARERAVGAGGGHGVPAGEAVDLARQLVDLVAAVHDQGLVLRDLSPNNVMVTPEGRLRLVDLEYAATPGARVGAVFTPGYAAPEVLTAPRFGPAPPATADLYSVGATMVYLAAGVDPWPVADRPTEARMRGVVGQLARDMPAVRQLACAVLGLTSAEPDQRWSLRRTRAFLAGTIAAPRAASTPESDLTERLLSDGLTHLVRTMQPHQSRLWPGDESGSDHDPSNVQQGAAGVLGVLTRAARDLGGDQLRRAVATTAAWIDERRLAISPLLPGLYFGRSGTAWALHDAAMLLGDVGLGAHAIALAKRVPVSWPNPDICHGTAGAGMAALYLWKATGDAELADRAREAADSVLAAAVERGGNLFWPVPDTFDSGLAGLTHYGYAHGVAGAGTFLLYAGIALGRGEYLDAARRAGDTLAAGADVEGDAAWWPPSQSEPGQSRWLHWCSGSAGVGTFLVRLWQVTGDERFRSLSEKAAVAIHRQRWYSNTSACHGLAGHGDFLLDLAHFTGRQRYRDWAHDVAAAIGARHVVRDGLAVLPGETGTDVTAGYNTGMAGPLGFILRLRHGGARWWMPDQLLDKEGDNDGHGHRDAGTASGRCR